MSIHVHRGLRLTPLAPKPPPRPLLAWLLPRRPAPTRTVVTHQEAPPCPSK